MLETGDLDMMGKHWENITSSYIYHPGNTVWDLFWGSYTHIWCILCIMCIIPTPSCAIHTYFDILVMDMYGKTNPFNIYIYHYISIIFLSIKQLLKTCIFLGQALAINLCLSPRTPDKKCFSLSIIKPYKTYSDGAVCLQETWYFPLFFNASYTFPFPRSWWWRPKLPPGYPHTSGCLPDRSLVGQGSSMARIGAGFNHPPKNDHWGTGGWCPPIDSLLSWAY